MSDEQNKLHIDTDWKTQAQQEKQRLAQQSKAAQQAASSPETQSPSPEAAGQPEPGQMPPANFETLMSTLATQALFAMGAIADPRTGQPHQNLDLARHHIDMLSVLEEKTKNNLTDEESDLLTGTLYELRSRYVQLANAARSK